MCSTLVATISTALNLTLDSSGYGMTCWDKHVSVVGPGFCNGGTNQPIVNEDCPCVQIINMINSALPNGTPPLGCTDWWGPSNVIVDASGDESHCDAITNAILQTFFPPDDSPLPPPSPPPPRPVMVCPAGYARTVGPSSYEEGQCDGFGLECCGCNTGCSSSPCTNNCGDGGTGNKCPRIEQNFQLTLSNMNMFGCTQLATSPPSPPPPSAPADGAIVELTGTAPRINFGPPLSPICSLKLNSLNNALESTCDIATPSTETRRLSGNDDLSDTFVTRTEHEELKMNQQALRDQLVELRRIVHELTH